MQNLLLLTGGASAEHDVSVSSRNNILKYIDTNRFNVISILIRKDKTWVSDDGNIWHLHKGNLLVSDSGEKISIDLIFPLVLGDAEDGTLQGYFQSLDAPFAGSKLLSSAIGFDKICAKRLLQSYDVNVVPFVEYAEGDTYQSVSHQLNCEALFIKPSRSGSSFGSACVRTQQEFENAIKEAKTYDHHILIEKNLTGVREIFCCLLEDDELITSEIGEAVYSTAFYDYEAKYSSTNAAEKIVPAHIPDDISELAKKLSCKIFRALRCQTFLRVDFFFHDGELYFSEVNTIPAMTPTSLFLKIMKESGYDEHYVVNKIIEQATLREELCF